MIAVIIIIILIIIIITFIYIELLETKLQMYLVVNKSNLGPVYTQIDVFVILISDLSSFSFGS